jgi:DMSO/TMAO reductase YedYZ molybdopterin-dependent catalytic subunit
MNLQQTVDLEHLCCFGDPSDVEGRKACLGLDPEGFFVRYPPTPHQLTSFITPDDQLFQTIHMGAAVIDLSLHLITIDGLVKRPFTLSLAQLRRFLTTSITAFHECYGSPVKPPTENI